MNTEFFDEAMDLALPIDMSFGEIYESLKNWKNKTKGKLFLIGTPLGVDNVFFPMFNESIEEPEEETIYFEV